MSHFMILLPEDQKQDIWQRAKEERTSASQWARRVLAAELSKDREADALAATYLMEILRKVDVFLSAQNSEAKRSGW